MSATLIKDGSIWLLLAELAQRLDSHQIKVVDHWDADLFAVGVARADAADKLVYVSTFRKEPGLYAYEAEEPGRQHESRPAARGDGVTLEQLVDILRHHLSIPPSLAREGEGSQKL